MAKRRAVAAALKKRKKTSDDAAKEEEEGTTSKSQEEDLQKEPKKTRVKAPKPKVETEYFSEKRNMEDLWQSAFPVGTEWDNMDKLSEINWCFSNLESAFEEGGELHGKTVYMFASTEGK
ncbi:hypothetical protein ZIOFF_054769 [Zingiber officinale]|uniref:Uncharacterized protein n=1 Tax=Zingiber officinale TaxID=94328 RepID=A0A8J5KPJ4_ZINOF|nr:hypothetical protein ZIOFF_054769 [Zingiber officinale]